MFIQDLPVDGSGRGSARALVAENETHEELIALRLMKDTPPNPFNSHPTITQSYINTNALNEVLLQQLTATTKQS